MSQFSTEELRRRLAGLQYQDPEEPVARPYGPMTSTITQRLTGGQRPPAQTENLFGGTGPVNLSGAGVESAAASPSGRRAADYLPAQEQRRNEGAGGFGQGAAKGLQVGLGVSKFVGPYAPIAIGGGALIGGIAGLASKNAKTAMTDVSTQQATDAITRAYRDALGRDPEPGAIDTHLRNQGLEPGGQWVGEAGITDVLNSILTGDEAQAYQQQQAQEALQALGLLPTGETAGGGSNAPQASAGTASGGVARGTGVLEGFDAGKLADPSHQTTKYRVGRILQGVPNGPNGLDAAWPAIQAEFPNAVRVGSDAVDFGDGYGPIDLQRDTEGGGGWHWEPVGGGGGGSAAGGAGPATGAIPTSPDLAALSDPGMLADILALISRLTQENGGSTAALLNQLQAGV